MNPLYRIHSQEKIMHLQKVAILELSKQPLQNGSNPMDSGIPSIHYTYFGVLKAGMVCGIVRRISAFPVELLAGSFLFTLNLYLLLVTRLPHLLFDVAF